MNKPPMKWGAIVNPRSGGKKSPSQIQAILTQLRSVAAHVEITQYPRHATELAYKFGDWDGIVVVGGDGTLFEVVQGMDVTRQHLAIIPAGTGNSLARDLGIRTFAQALESVHADNRIRIDLLRVTLTTADDVTEHYQVVSTLGLGYPANVRHTGNQRFKAWGKLCYPVAATLGTFHNPLMQANVGYDGRPAHARWVTGVLLNNTQHAGNFRAFPEALVDDGHLDVMELRAGCVGQNLHNLAVLSQTYLYHPAKCTRATAFSIECERPQWLMLDGELQHYSLALTRGKNRVSSRNPVFGDGTRVNRTE